MVKYNLQNTKESYIAAWNGMEIHPDRLPIVKKIAQKIISLKNTYLALEQDTGVPWYFIGLVHMRESNFDFATHLHNGDPLNVNGKFKRTTHVPANRPSAAPGNSITYTFEESAIDALEYEFGKITHWDIAQIAFLMEKYNGFGYRQKGLPSPYLWASSNMYSRGKYIRDGVFDPTVVDTQLGVMVVLRCIFDIIEPIDIINPSQEETIDVKQNVPISPSADIERPKAKGLRKVSTKFKLLDWGKHLLGWGTGVTASVKTLDVSNISATRTFVDTIHSFANDYGIFIFLGVMILAFIVVHFITERMKDDIADNRYTPSGDA